MEIIFQALYFAHKCSNGFEHARIDFKLRVLLARATDKGLDVCYGHALRSWKHHRSFTSIIWSR
jgi:hypothetical protein